MSNGNCFHCGNSVDDANRISFQEKEFCCVGCKTVFEIFDQNELSCYYDFQSSPGATPQDIKGKYDYLDDENIQRKILEFREAETYVVSLYIPHIHCSSCIWILENLQKLQPGVITSQVNFPQKKVRITYQPNATTLKELVNLLAKIGYEPYISLENLDGAKEVIDRSLIYKIGVAFFCFGNVMLLSFPEYFEVEEFWIEKYKYFFRWLIFGLSMPAFFYSASGYYVSAWKSIRSGLLNIDIPIALGIVVMFIRSAVDIIFDFGPGFFDSMTGLIFFMLLGKLFQQKTYSFLSFERDYKSYFPIAVTRKIEGREEAVQVYDIKKGDRLLIRNQELIPVDGILISKEATIDYSFVTGEAMPIHKVSGDKLFAGGKQLGAAFEMEVLHSVSQSYLTQLWSNDVFNKEHKQAYQTITDTISRYFTPALLLLSLIALIVWLFIDVYQAFNVFTAILIVACPCALALTAPFTLGNVLRIMGKNKLYLKNASVIERMSEVNHLVFDKTGTITSHQKSRISSEVTLNDDEKIIVKSVLQNSNHPLSRQLYEQMPDVQLLKLDVFEEITGKGIVGFVQGNEIKIGSASFTESQSKADVLQTRVYISINGVNKGYFVFHNTYRNGLSALFNKLSAIFSLSILSGDNAGEQNVLQDLLPKNVEMVFDQKPDQKLNFVKQLQTSDKNVMMIGDGLNDAGALAQSNVGISISENVNVFSPACDGILDASMFTKIDDFLYLSRKAMLTIKMSFALSLMYNLVGLSFAVSGKLSPLVAAIIMPLSTVTIVSFVTLMSNFYASRRFSTP